MPKDVQNGKKTKKATVYAEPAPLYNHSERPFNSRRIITASNIAARQHTGLHSALIPGQAAPLFGDHEELDNLYAPMDLGVDDVFPRRPRGNSLTQEEQDRTGERVIKKAVAKRYANSVSLLQMPFLLSECLTCLPGCTYCVMGESPRRVSG